MECLTEFETCSETEQFKLKSFFELISSVLHKQYHERQIRVQKLYQPLDPDSVLILKDPETKNSSEVFRPIAFEFSHWPTIFQDFSGFFRIFQDFSGFLGFFQDFFEGGR